MAAVVQEESNPRRWLLLFKGYAFVGWPSLHIHRQTHWLQVIQKSFLGKAPSYLSLLVSIAAPIHSTRSSRYISLVIPKANSSFGRISFQFSAANDWNDHCTCTQPIFNSPSNYLIPIVLFFLFFCSFASQYLYLHTHLLHIFHSSVKLLNCNYFATMDYLLP